MATSKKTTSTTSKKTAPTFDDLARAVFDAATAEEINAGDVAAEIVAAESQVDAIADLVRKATVVAAEIMFGKRGTQAAIGKRIAEVNGCSVDAGKKHAERLGKIGRILIAHPAADPMQVRTFVRTATDDQITAAIAAKGDPVAAGKRVGGKKTPGKRGPGKKTPRTFRQQVEAASKENARCITMAKEAPVLPPVADFDLLIASLRATLATAEKMRETVAASEKVA